jgi:hypothetical protein
MTFRVIKESKTIEPQTMENLNKIDEDLKTNSDSKFVKFADQQKAVFEFLPEKASIIFKKWDGSKFHESETQDDEDFKKNYRFVVLDPNMKNMERTWDCSNYKAASTIVSFLKMGITVLKIKRIGEKKDTIYDIEPIGGGIDTSQEEAQKEDDYGF